MSSETVAPSSNTSSPSGGRTPSMKTPVLSAMRMPHRLQNSTRGSLRCPREQRKPLTLGRVSSGSCSASAAGGCSLTTTGSGSRGASSSGGASREADSAGAGSSTGAGGGGGAASATGTGGGGGTGRGGGAGRGRGRCRLGHRDRRGCRHRWVRVVVGGVRVVVAGEVRHGRRGRRRGDGG